MTLTETGTLKYGVEVDGVRHKDFELRQPTMADVEDGLEAAGEGACQARVNRHVWARALTKLGTLPQDKITAELLGSLPDTEYGILSAAEEALRESSQPRAPAPRNSGS